MPVPRSATSMAVPSTVISTGSVSSLNLSALSTRFDTARSTRPRCARTRAGWPNVTVTGAPGSPAEALGHVGGDVGQVDVDDRLDGAGVGRQLDHLGHEVGEFLELIAGLGHQGLAFGLVQGGR